MMGAVADVVSKNHDKLTTRNGSSTRRVGRDGEKPLHEVN
jgi:hypothetical protein